MSRRPSNGCARFSGVEPTAPSRCLTVASLVAAAVSLVLCGCRIPRAEAPAPERRGLEGTVIVPEVNDSPGEDAPAPPPVAAVPEGSVKAEAGPATDPTPDPPKATRTADATAPRAAALPLAEPEPEPPDTSPPNHLPPAFAADPPERIHRPVPVFPPWTDIDEILGSHAVFRIDIDEGGNVIRAELLETTAEDNVEPAREALLESRYRPVLSPAGVPVRATIVERIEF